MLLSSIFLTPQPPALGNTILASVFMSTAFYIQPTYLFTFLFIVIYVYSSCFLCLEFSSTLYPNSHSLTSYKFLLRFTFSQCRPTQTPNIKLQPPHPSQYYKFSLLCCFFFLSYISLSYIL